MKRLLATTALVGALSAACVNLAAAQDPYLGEIRLFGYNWCPQGWLVAAGQTLSISQYSALFALYGTNFGGNGQTNFGLPNLSGRAPYGIGAGGVGQPFAAIYGNSNVTLTVQNLPAHTHQLFGSSAIEGTSSPTNAILPTLNVSTQKFYASSGSPADRPMAANAVGLTGSNIPVTVQSPALTLNWCVAMQGIFPTRP